MQEDIQACSGGAAGMGPPPGTRDSARMLSSPAATPTAATAAKRQSGGLWPRMKKARMPKQTVSRRVRMVSSV